jgi:hypothetical protein
LSLSLIIPIELRRGFGERLIEILSSPFARPQTSERSNEGDARFCTGGGVAFDDVIRSPQLTNNDLI